MSAKPTGERFLPGEGGRIALEHWHRYRLVQKLSAGRTVLDIACGEGYGSAYLAENAAQVVGADLDAATVAEAQERYQAPNLRYMVGDCTAIPLESATFDLVVSFETIEHHDAHAAMIAEIKRVLVPGGLVVLSSPDRRVYSDLEGHKNPFHVKELDRDELLTLLQGQFQHVALLGQRSLLVSLIGRETPDATLSREGVLPPWEYFIALCSDSPLPDLERFTGVFSSDDDGTRRLERAYVALEDEYRKLENTIGGQLTAYRQLEADVRQRNIEIAADHERFAQREAEFQELVTARNSLEERFLRLEAEARGYGETLKQDARRRQSRTYRIAAKLARLLGEGALWS